jgi:hypothetical protein
MTAAPRGDAGRPAEPNVTAGLDLSPWIVERTYGPALADEVAAEIEHRRGSTRIAL